MLALFVFNSCLFGVILAAELYLHQLKTSSNLHSSEEEVSELRISKSIVEHGNQDFVWIKNWEFQFHGEMYDIVKSHIENEEYVFNVKHDKKEDIIRRHAEREAKHNNDTRDSRSKKNVKVAGEYFYKLEYSIWSIGLPIASKIFYNGDITVAHRSLPDPPPWLS